MNDLLKGYPGIFEINVAWGEMDAFQHVNNVVYFRYFESARIAYFREISYMKYLERNQMGPILASISCTFKAPLNFPDVITVGTRVSKMEGDRFTMNHLIYSSQLRRITTECESLIVNYDYKNGCKAEIPTALREEFIKMEEEE